jgi:murein DD-endopeptidase MepM/ murein hydrolase activator NlpD
LPFDYPDPASLPSWWGFGGTTFAREHRYDFYRLTAGLHSGVDWGIPLETPLIWTGNIDGKVIDSRKYTYMNKESYIVIEAGGFHFIYGHTSSVSLEPGDTVKPGQTIGYSGQDKYGNMHLHFEIRPKPVYDAVP